MAGYSYKDWGCGESAYRADAVEVVDGDPVGGDGVVGGSGFGQGENAPADGGVQKANTQGALEAGAAWFYGVEG